MGCLLLTDGTEATEACADVILDLGSYIVSRTTGEERGRDLCRVSLGLLNTLACSLRFPLEDG